MIDFKTPDYFLAVLQWAVANNCAKQLTERLDYLANYGDGNNVVELYADFAPQSFEFLMKKPDGSRWFNGGLIYSGPGQPLDGSSPALTVSLGKTGHEHKWSVHT